MSVFKFAIAGLGALAIAACATNTPPAVSTGSGTTPNGAQPAPPSNPDGTTPQQ